MTATYSTEFSKTLFSKTLYAPNPPQLDDPWVKLLVAIFLGFVGAALCLGS